MSPPRVVAKRCHSTLAIHTEASDIDGTRAIACNSHCVVVQFLLFACCPLSTPSPTYFLLAPSRPRSVCVVLARTRHDTLHPFTCLVMLHSLLMWIVAGELQRLVHRTHAVSLKGYVCCTDFMLTITHQLDCILQLRTYHPHTSPCSLGFARPAAALHSAGEAVNVCHRRRFH